MGIITKWSPGILMQLSARKDVWEWTNRMTGESTRISRSRLFSFVASGFENLIFALTPEEEADIAAWDPQTIKCAVEDRFITAGFSWQEMEQWMADCYRIQENPMRALRRILEGCLPGAIYYVTVFKCREWPESFHPGLTCIHDQRNSLNPSVKLVAHGTFEELAQAEAKRERMLKIASIRETAKRERVLRHL